MDEKDKMFEIRDAHIAALQVMIYNSAVQRVASEEILRKLATLNGEDPEEEIKKFTTKFQAEHLRVVNEIYGKFGILDLKDILDI